MHLIDLDLHKSENWLKELFEINTLCPSLWTHPQFPSMELSLEF